MVSQTSSASLRARLREATRSLHERLDARFAPGDICDPAIYGGFLAAQLSARAPIESWARLHCPADLTPPASSHLLIEDLIELGRPFSQRGARFSLPPDNDPLGLAWVVAGSHLGNRVMLKRIETSGTSLPRRFLADSSMIEFWNLLRPRLERESTPSLERHAIEAARATFLHFDRAFAGMDRKAAA